MGVYFNRLINNTNVNKNFLNETNKIFLDKEDISFNLDKFYSGESNLLFITGLSGSGKTTLSKEIHDEYPNSILIELDTLQSDSIQILNYLKPSTKEQEFLKNFLDSLPEEYRKVNMRKCARATFEFIMSSYIEYIINYSEDYPDCKLIVEGIQIFNFHKYGVDISKYPIIIKQTSLLNSLLRKIQRDKITAEDLSNPAFTDELIRWYFKSNKNLNNFECRLLKEEYELDKFPALKDNHTGTILDLQTSNSEDADDSPQKTQVAKAWMKNNNAILITPHGSMKELNNQMNQWLSQADNQKDRSDAMSMQLYGVNNKDHYEELYNKLVGTIDTDYTDIEQTDNPHVFLSKQENALEEAINIMKDNLNGKDTRIVKQDLNEVFDCMNNLPYFTPEEMIEKGVFKNQYRNFYNAIPDNRQLSENITVKEWNEYYALKSKGILTEEDNMLTTLWIQKLNELYSDYEKIKNEGNIDVLNSRKQSILELGWNPEIDFNPYTRKLIDENTKNKLKQNHTTIIDMTNLRSSIKESMSSITEYTEMTKDGKFPIFLVLVYTASTFGKVITKYTKSVYSHAAIGLDSSLEKLYSFNMNNKVNLKGGFSNESLSGYIKDNPDSKIAVYTVFVNKNQFKNITNKIKYYTDHIKETGYGILNLFGILINKPIKKANDMICSQFADMVLKTVNYNITDKDSSLVTPNDLYIKANEKKIYKLFEGRATDYKSDHQNISKVIKSINTKKKAVKENSIIINNESDFINALYENRNDINSLISLEEGVNILSEENKKIFEENIYPYLHFDYLCEVKEFPVQFDKEGNLLISRMRDINFDKEYVQSHKLLQVYEKNKNIESMKYEVAKLWFLNLLLEDIIYNRKKRTSITIEDAYKSRARILNDFNKYIKFIAKHDKDYNFTIYYNQTPFSDATIKINNTTLKYGKDILKSIKGLLL